MKCPVCGHKGNLRVFTVNKGGYSPSKYITLPCRFCNNYINYDSETKEVNQYYSTKYIKSIREYFNRKSNYQCRTCLGYREVPCRVDSTKDNYAWMMPCFSCRKKEHEEMEKRIKSSKKWKKYLKTKREQKIEEVSDKFWTIVFIIIGAILLLSWLSSGNSIECSGDPDCQDFYESESVPGHPLY